MWQDIKKRVTNAPPLSALHKEQDLCLRTLRDYYTPDVSEVLVDDHETYVNIREYMRIISPRNQRRVKLYKEKSPIFEQYDIERQIESIYSHKVPLKSGGSVVIDSTEALISIDVNSGRGTVGKDAETMTFRTNLEATREISRQLRLRDLGGLVVIDFIDMKDRKHVREVEKVLREELKKDRAKTDTSHISKFGLMELSRQRQRPSLESKSHQVCQYCHGRGMIRSVESTAVSFLRQIWMGVAQGDVALVNGNLPLEVTTYLQNRKRKELATLEQRHEVTITLQGNPALSPGDGELEFVKRGQA
jgi:ribonuclease E